MFIVSLQYKVSTEVLESYLSDHRTFLDRHYQLGNFLMSGPKNPRDGGIIIANLQDKKHLKSILEEDPFKINDLASYEIIEFRPTKTAEQIGFLRED